MADIPGNEAVELDLTPMIDVVFLLLIFFMLVSEISKMDVAELSLPYAARADDKPDTTDMNTLITINIQRKRGGGLGTVIIQGVKYNKDENLREYILKQAQHAGYEAEDPGGCNLRVRIRADREATTKAVQRVFDACQRHKVYKIEVGASPAPDAGYDPAAFKPRS